MNRTILATILAIGSWACSANQPAAQTPAAEQAEPAPAPVEMNVEEVAAKLESGADVFLLDVRTPEELKEHGMIAGAVNIPIDQLPARLSEVPRDKEIITYCMRGGRASSAADILREAGYTEPIEFGGITAWKEAGKPVVQPGE
jgi:rhodanese-related sulfurtransferase